MKEVEEARNMLNEIVSVKNFFTGIHLILAVGFVYAGVVMTYFVGKKLNNVIPWQYVGYSIAGMFAVVIGYIFICYCGYIINRIKGR